MVNKVISHGKIYVYHIFVICLLFIFVFCWREKMICTILFYLHSLTRIPLRSLKKCKQITRYVTTKMAKKHDLIFFTFS